MVDITYEVIGAGSNEENRIIVSVNCDDTIATICWIGRTKYKSECEESYDDERYCDDITIVPGDGEITWNEKPVYYTINRYCPEQPEPSCNVECSELSVYTIPKYITDDNDEVEIHYQYYLTDICDKNKETESIKSRFRKTGVDTKKFSEFFTHCDDNGKCVERYKIEGYENACSTDVAVFKTEPTACTNSCRADVSITFSQKIIPSTGATINVVVSFKKVMTDDECHKTTKTGSFTIPWEISECECVTTSCTIEQSSDEVSGTGGTVNFTHKMNHDCDEFSCCEDHYVISSITISDLIAKCKLADCDKIYYNGKLVTTGITYSILQRAKYTDECEHYCTPETTYCADKNSVKVYYETSYMSDEWVSSMSVPSTGGRIKVEWNYTGETTTPDCTKYTTSGTWEEIIVVGACDEKPTDCKGEYKGEDGHSTTCEVCDAECCYNYDGNGNCKCVIYFKKRTPTCKTCDASPTYYYFPSIDDSALFDNREDAIDFALDNGKTEEEALILIREINFNLIRYEFNQDCTVKPDECTCNNLIIEDEPDVCEELTLKLMGECNCENLIIDGEPEECTCDNLIVDDEPEECTCDNLIIEDESDGCGKLNLNLE